jgi:hypothetical protein
MVTKRFQCMTQAHTDQLPDEMLRKCAAFSLSGLADLSAFGAVSRRFFAAARAASRDGNAPLWAASVRDADPVLHAGIVHARDVRRTWRARLLHLRQLQQDAAREAPPRFCPAPRRRPSEVSSSSSATDPAEAVACVDVLLYNHPTQGFMINVGEVRHKVCVYGLRQRDAAVSAQAMSTHADRPPSLPTTAAVKLSPFRLPTYATGAPAPLGPATTNVLVLLSLNGKSVSDFGDFDDLVAGIKAAPELCRWRFLFYPASNLRHLPRECSFGGPVRASNPPADGAE